MQNLPGNFRLSLTYWRNFSKCTSQGWVVSFFVYVMYRCLCFYLCLYDYVFFLDLCLYDYVVCMDVHILLLYGFICCLPVYCRFVVHDSVVYWRGLQYIFTKRLQSCRFRRVLSPRSRLFRCSVEEIYPSEYPVHPLPVHTYIQRVVWPNETN